MKKFLAILLAALMLFSLTACGGDKDSVAAADPNLGVYNGVSVVTLGMEMDIAEVYGEGNSIELKDGGKASFILGGDEMKCDWELKGEELTLSIEGVKSSGTLKDGVLTVDFMDMGIDMVFAKEGAAVSAPAASEDPAALDGFYPVYSAVIGGEEIDHELLVMAEVAESYVIFNSDGSGEIYFQDSESDTFTYDLETGILTDSSGVEFVFYVEGDAVTVEYPLQDMTMTYVLDASAMWDGLEPGESAGSITDLFGGTDSALLIENPSVWYGWLTLTDFWGIDQEEDIYDCWAYVDTDSNGRSFFEVYQDGYPEDAFFSMYADVVDGLFIEPIIGDEDAWISDTYIDPENDDTMYEGRLIRNNTLVFEFPYEHSSGEYGCKVNLCFRPDGELWDEENDVLPPRYEEYKAAILGGSSDGAETPAEEPVDAGAAPSGFGGEHSEVIDEFMTNQTAEFTFTLPESGWVLEKPYSTIYLYNVPTLDDAYSNSPRIQFELKQNLEKINFYIDQFENVKEIDSRVISGIELAGRTYKHVGMEWIEYYGELPSGIWVTVKISRTSVEPGSEGAAILDSVTIK